MTTPKLQGTEKQIKWADEIRSATIADLDRQISSYLLNQVEYTEKLKEAALAAIAEKVEAKWWIENRHCDGFSTKGKEMWRNYVLVISSLKQEIHQYSQNQGWV